MNSLLKKDTWYEFTLHLHSYFLGKVMQMVIALLVICQVPILSHHPFLHLWQFTHMQYYKLFSSMASHQLHSYSDIYSLSETVGFTNKKQKFCLGFMFPHY
mmetsp:Transcript_10814/g.14139  ORF Transcript_10814/g.14139 Transcript_10814/m.14139 type:complete len:101 (+) Transcript_10814:1084-1386(+)